MNRILITDHLLEEFSAGTVLLPPCPELGRGQPEEVLQELVLRLPGRERL